MADYLNLRIQAALGERAKKHAQTLDRTPNKFAEMCIEAICEMIENPSARVLPAMVATADLEKSLAKQPIPLSSKVTAYPAGQEGLRAAEEPAHPPAAQPRRARGK